MMVILYADPHDAHPRNHPDAEIFAVACLCQGNLFLGQVWLLSSGGSSPCVLRLLRSKLPRDRSLPGFIRAVRQNNKMGPCHDIGVRSPCSRGSPSCWLALRTRPDLVLFRSRAVLCRFPLGFLMTSWDLEWLGLYLRGPFSPRSSLILLGPFDW